jgi:hypothetical protein
MMTKLEHYTAKAAESLAAVEAATTARDRAFHHRAHAIWRRLIAGVAEAEQREALRPARATPARRTAA